MFILRMIDVIGPELKLKIKKKDTYKTGIGGFLTIIYLGLISVAFLCLVLDLVYRTKPIIVFNNPSFTIDSTTFAFSITEQDYIQNNYQYENKFSFSLYEMIYKEKDNYTITKHRIEKCNNTDISNIINKSDLPHKADYWCLPKNEKIEIKGTYLINGSFIKLHVDLCNNDTKNITDCTPMNETTPILPGLLLTIIFDDFYTDSLHYSNPLIPSYHIEHFLSNNNTFSRTTLYFKKIVYETDSGFLTNNTDIKTKNVFDYSDSSPISVPNTNTTFSILIVNSKNKDLYQRSYMKIQGIFSIVGGYITISQILLGIICKYLTYPNTLEIFYKKYYRKKTPPETNSFISNEIKINGKLYQKSKISTKSVKIDEIENQERNFPENTLSECSNEDKFNSAFLDRPKNEEKIFKTRKTKFSLEISFDLKKFSICDKLFRMFLCFWGKEKRSQFKKLDQLFLKKFSVEHFIKLSRKISLIEALLFQRYQRELLKYVGVPKFKRIYTPYEKSIEELNLNISNPINQNLLRYLNNEFD